MKKAVKKKTPPRVSKSGPDKRKLFFVWSREFAPKHIVMVVREQNTDDAFTSRCNMAMKLATCDTRQAALRIAASLQRTEGTR